MYSLITLTIEKCYFIAKPCAAGACHSSPMQSFENEQERCRRHVAVILENGSGTLQKPGFQTSQTNAFSRTTLRMLLRALACSSAGYQTPAGMVCSLEAVPDRPRSISSTNAAVA
jgi:hypothetical protein